ncbi:hypothetical protein ACFL38_00830 [Candidatus Omnitrophota bacterium]
MKTCKNRRGQILIVTLGVALFLIMTSSVFLSVLINEQRSLDTQKRNAEAFYLADGAMKRAVERFDIDNIAGMLEDPNTDTAVRTYTYPIGLFSGAEATSTYWHMADLDQADGSRTYGIRTTLDHPNLNDIEATIYRAIRKQKLSILDHVLFSDGDLVYRKGQETRGKIYANGKLWLAPRSGHGLEGHSGRIFSDSVRAGDLIMHWDPDIADDEGWKLLSIEISSDPEDIDNIAKLMSIREGNPSLPPEEYLVYDGTQLFDPNILERYFNLDPHYTVPSDQWGDVALDRWGGIVRDSASGVEAFDEADLEIDISPSGEFAAEAGLRIEVDENGDIAIVHPTEFGDEFLTPGEDFSEEAIIVEYHPSTALPDSPLATHGEFWDVVEYEIAARIIVDIEKLAGICEGSPCQCRNPDVYDPTQPPASQPPGAYIPCANSIPSNGLMYITRDDIPLEDAQSVPAVSLRNSSEIYLPDDAQANEVTGLTVATDKHLYTEGDVNTINTKPLAVVCDSHTTLSNTYQPNDSCSASYSCWNDADTDRSTETLIRWGDAARFAFDQTTINAAIISGSWEGRIIEKWRHEISSRVTPGDAIESNGRYYTKLNYGGSFIKLVDPVYSTTHYSTPDSDWILNEPPARFFSWDETFANDLPPFMEFLPQLDDSEGIVVVWAANMSNPPFLPPPGEESEYRDPTRPDDDSGEGPWGWLF